MPSLLAAQLGCDNESYPELASSGLMVAGRLDPLVASLLHVMTDPDLMISVEISNAAGLNLVTFWRQRRRAVVGTTGPDRQFYIALIAADLLPFHLAQSVGLAPRDHPRYTGHFTVPREVLARARRQSRSEPAAAEDELLGAGVAPAWAERLVAAMLLLRSRWAMESVSLALPQSSTSLAIMDSAHAGMWRIRQVEDDLLQVIPIGFDELFDQLAAMVQ